jgi:Spy/CpxP family protein refolding chaperone
MNFKAIALATTLALSPLMAQAAIQDLPTPIIELMPHVKKLAESGKLQLTAEQKKVLDDWMANAPAKRKAMEADYVQLRQELRTAILDNKDRIEREKLTSALLAKEEELIKMRGICHRMLVKELTPAQFDMVKTAYLNSIK